MEIYAELGELYRRAGSFESSIEFYQQAAILAERLNCPEDLAYACRAIAEISVDPSQLISSFVKFSYISRKILVRNFKLIK